MTTTDDGDDGLPPDQVITGPDGLRIENDVPHTRPRSRIDPRSRFTVALVVVTALSLVATSLAVWVHRTVFDTDRFMDTVTPALDDPAFYAVLSDRTAEQVLMALDLDTRVTARLTSLEEYLAEGLPRSLGVSDQERKLLSAFDRPSLAALGPVVVGALEERVVAAIDRFITSEEFQALLPELVRRAHVVAVAAVRGDAAGFPNVYRKDGVVRLNLLPVIAEALRPVVEDLRGYLPDVAVPAVVSDDVDEGLRQLAEGFSTELPDDFGQIPLATEEKLDDVQQVAHRLDQFVWALTAATAALLAATVAVSTRRRRTVVQLGLGILSAFVVAWVIVRRAKAVVLERISDPNGSRAVGTLLDALRESYRTTVFIVAGVALVALLIGHVAGRPSWLDRVGRWTAARFSQDEPGGSTLNVWVEAHYDSLRTAGGFVAVVALFSVGLELPAVVTIGLLLTGYLLALGELHRRSTGEAQTTG